MSPRACTYTPADQAQEHSRSISRGSSTANPATRRAVMATTHCCRRTSRRVRSTSSWRAQARALRPRYPPPGRPSHPPALRQLPAHHHPPLTLCPRRACRRHLPALRTLGRAVLPRALRSATLPSPWGELTAPLGSWPSWPSSRQTEPLALTTSCPLSARFPSPDWHGGTTTGTHTAAAPTLTSTRGWTCSLREARPSSQRRAATSARRSTGPSAVWPSRSPMLQTPSTSTLT